MQLALWDFLLNGVLFLLWFTIWTGNRRPSAFNPYAATLERVGASLVGLFRRRPGRIPERTATWVLLALLIVLRAFAFRYLSRKTGLAWPFPFGALVFQIHAEHHGAGTFLFFSLASFGAFLFYLWGLSLLYVHSRAVTAMSHSEATLHAASRPFVWLVPRYRPWALLLFGMLLAGLMRQAASRGSLPSTDSLTIATLKLALSALVAWVHCLPILLNALIGLIIGSWVAMFAGSPSVAHLCREWTDLILGPIRRYPLRIGMIDLSPILFFLAVQFLSVQLLAWLLRVYGTLPQP
jgi:uncharacterized protein YggT (Ycf19 family)